MIERVLERGRRNGETEAGQIRRNDSMAFRQLRNQVSEHVGGRREAVQQKNGRRVCRTRFAIEDIVLRHHREPVMHDRRETGRFG